MTDKWAFHKVYKDVTSRLKGFAWLVLPQSRWWVFGSGSAASSLGWQVTGFKPLQCVRIRETYAAGQIAAIFTSAQFWNLSEAVQSPQSSNLSDCHLLHAAAIYSNEDGFYHREPNVILLSRWPSWGCYQGKLGITKAGSQIQAKHSHIDFHSGFW